MWPFSGAMPALVCQSRSREQVPRSLMRLAVDEGSPCWLVDVRCHSFAAHPAAARHADSQTRRSVASGAWRATSCAAVPAVPGLTRPWPCPCWGRGSVPRTHVWADRPWHGGTKGGPLARQGTRR